MPLLRQCRRVHRQSKPVVEPLFPGYLFTRFDVEQVLVGVRDTLMQCKHLERATFLRDSPHSSDSLIPSHSRIENVKLSHSSRRFVLNLKRQILMSGFRTADVAVMAIAFTIGLAVSAERMSMELQEFLAVRVKLSNILLVRWFCRRLASDLSVRRDSTVPAESA